MKIIKPSAHIIDYGNMNLLEKIELAGRLCYRSEDKITPGSAEKFVADVIKRGHMSVLEMGHVTFQTGWLGSDFSDFMDAKPKYFSITTAPKGVTISATPRAILEFWVNNKSLALAEDMFETLCYLYPVFDMFIDGRKPEKMLEVLTNEDISPEHTYYGVRFIVGRHTSHELVRHRANGVLQESQRYCRYSDSKFGSEVTFIKPVGLKDMWSWKNAMAVTEGMYFDLLKNNPPQIARTVLPNSTKTEVIIYANVPQWQHILRLRTTPACDPSMLEVMVPLKEEFRAKGVEV